MTENEWDKLLKIQTTGRDDSHSDTYRYPYEPTSDEYIACLMQEEELSFYDEINCMDLFGGSDDRERIMIFTI